MSQDKNGGATIANPAPLGLMGFAMTTILLNLHNAGLYGVSIVIVAMGIFYGGMAQVIAGLMEFKKGATFGALAFSSYGFFWIVLAAIFVFGPGVGAAGAVDSVAMGCFLAIWGLFSLVLFVCTLKQSRTNQVIFASLVILFVLLAASKFAGGETGALIGRIAGFEGIFCGLSAFYGAAAQLINEVYGKKVLPL